MATTQDPPKQHKQPSRKGKKAWRKNVDLTEVESGLDTVRDEVIATGYPTSHFLSFQLPAAKLPF
jgi:nucleolar protein 53